MITNIIDNRKHRYRFLKVNAIAEATWHDNSCPDADHCLEDGPTYVEREHVTITEAIAWASALNGHVTLYLYDKDDYRLR